MQILSRSILRLFRRPNLTVPTLQPPMHRLSPPLRSLLSSTPSAPPRWWPPALARRCAPLLTEAPNRPARRVSRSGVKGEELRKLDSRRLIPSANDPIRTTNIEENRAPMKEFIARYGDGRPANGEEDGGRASMDVFSRLEDSCRTTVEATDGKRDAESCNGCPRYGEEDASCETEVSDGEQYASLADEEDASCYQDGCPADFVRPMVVLELSSHRDGSIYRNTRYWEEYRVADRNETRLESMMNSDPKDCILDHGSCIRHAPSRMLQIISLKLAKIHVGGGSVDAYGYIAVRDLLDPLLNYVVNFSRDDPINLEQGSLIEMTGPKRGIELYGATLIEYDMRIKTEDQENDDLQLIDGLSLINDRSASCHAFTERIHGDCGAVDITVSRLDHAVEATVQVVISEVPSNFDLCIGCFSSGLHEEIRLFHGAICEPRALRRHVVAVVMGTWMHLKVKVGSLEHCCSFYAVNHGCSSQQIKIESASILVKVTWSTLPF
ncbi:uncharacterized protein LOC133914190 [Phragmites australis]|uniref:uncharacterized protein LOC133914190 n=1 Tax=Phragmites australis TaxID=29695 RepID=UPI002D784F05|nr:uncharacterized protein LOC133914190 [Phragmites australis]